MMDENEKFVRENWECGPEKDGLWLNESAKSIRLDLGKKEFKNRTMNRTAVWSEAAKFTSERLKQIENVEEEINLLKSWLNGVMTCSDTTGLIYDRILAREQSVLAELKKGMR